MYLSRNCVYLCVVREIEASRTTKKCLFVEYTNLCMPFCVRFYVFSVIFLSLIETHRGFSYFYLYFNCKSLVFILFVSQPALQSTIRNVCVPVIWLPKINIEYLNLKIPAVKLSYRHMSPHSNNLKYFEICLNFRKIYSCHEWKMRRKTKQNLEKMIYFNSKGKPNWINSLLSRHRLNFIV